MSKIFFIKQVLKDNIDVFFRHEFILNLNKVYYLFSFFFSFNFVVINVFFMFIFINVLLINQFEIKLVFTSYNYTYKISEEEINLFIL